MSQETEQLREGIRSGAIQCPCRNTMLQNHFQGCPWIAAVNRIYELERKEEKKR